jgi:hypothetical protein
MRKTGKPLLVVLCLVFLFTVPSSAASSAWVTQTYAPGPADNPLKGFVPYQGTYTTFPYSMEWQYIAWKDVQTGFTTFTWDTLDTLLNRVSRRGHHLVFRIYADYPGTAYGVPGFLSNVPKHSYTDYENTTSASPDYDNADLRTAMKNLIAALGKRYDGDARIGFITIGLIGFWGEWHTYRASCGCDTWMPSIATQDEILSAFDSAFATTKILMREPKGTNPAGRAIGYHDDSFNYSTYGPVDWYFWPTIIAAGAQNKWRTEAIGGELRPEIQVTTWQTAGLCDAGGQQCFDTAVDITHASWLIAHALFEPGLSGVNRDRAVAAGQRMGYDLFVSSVALPDTVVSDSFRVDMKIQNRGVAPFYYDWPVRLGILNAANRIVASWNTTWKLTSVIDKNADVAFSFVKAWHGLAKGSYRLLLQAVNPLPGGRPLCFANKNWELDSAGWLTLGGFIVTQDPVFITRPTARRTLYDQIILTARDGAVIIKCDREVSGSIVDMLGRTAVRFSHVKNFTWQGIDAKGNRSKNGMYLVRVSTGSQTRVRKVFLER